MRSNLNVTLHVDPKGKQAFREEIQAELKPLIEKAELKEVFFADFVVE